MSIPEGAGSNVSSRWRGGFTVSWTTAALVTVLVVALAGIVGFYIGKNQAAVGQQPTLAAAAPQRPARQLPKGVTRLPAETFGNWNLNCLESAQKKKKCELVLRAVDKARKALVLSLAIVRNPKGTPLLVVVTPPSAMLSAGVRLAPEGGPELNISFAACGPGACQAEIAFTDKVVTALSSATSLQVSYVAGTGRPIRYKLPNAGFSDGYAAWEAN